MMLQKIGANGEEISAVEIPFGRSLNNYKARLTFFREHFCEREE